MNTSKDTVTSYITRKCAAIVSLVFRMKIPPKKRIQSVNRHLVEVVKSDVENNEISIGLYQDVSSFGKGNEKVRLLRHIIKKYRLRMLKQKLDKTKKKLETTEDDNLMLRDRNSLLKYQQTMLEDSWTRARFQCTDIRFEMGQALQAERGENASLVTEIRRLRQELVGFKTGAVLQAERDEKAILVTENSRLEKELEAVKRELDKKLDEDPSLICCLTLQRFEHPVYASDGNTYEKAALEQWITAEVGLRP